VDINGSPTYDPREDRIFIEELRRRLKSEIKITEVDANLEDPEFAEAIVEAAMEAI
jgi:uncharacterized protein (UPF0261 family)